MGSEPDVLFWFNGADANSFIEAGKVISIDDIRKEYPEYASNMNDDLIAASLVDGKKYAVPVNGFWEAMFVNTTVLDAAGVEYRDRITHGISSLQTVRRSKRQATARSQQLSATFRITGGNTPSSITTPRQTTVIFRKRLMTHRASHGWQASTISKTYMKKYFPKNTLSATDDDTFLAFTEDKAAFLIDGSWKVGGIAGMPV